MAASRTADIEKFISDRMTDIVSSMEYEGQRTFWQRLHFKSIKENNWNNRKEIFTGNLLVVFECEDMHISLSMIALWRFCDPCIVTINFQKAISGSRLRIMHKLWRFNMQGISQTKVQTRHIDHELPVHSTHIPSRLRVGNLPWWHNDEPGASIL